MIRPANAANRVRSRELGCTRTAPLPRAVRELAVRVGRLLNTRSLSTVSALSDHQLNDIGVVAADFRWTVRQRLHIDASGGLTRLNSEPRLSRGQRRC